MTVMDDLPPSASRTAEDITKLDPRDRKIRALTAKVHELKQQRIEERSTYLRQIKAIEAQVTSQLSYRLGRCITRNARSPIGWFKMPWQMLGEFRSYRKERAAREAGQELAGADINQATMGPKPIALRPIPLHGLTGAWRSGGADAVLAELQARRDERHQDSDVALALIKASKELVKAGFADAEHLLTGHAMEMQPEQPSMIRAHFWAALRAGDPIAAARLINRLEKLLQTHPDAEEEIYLARMREQRCFQICTADQILPPGPIHYTPVEKRLCYVLNNSLPYTSNGYATRSQGVAQGLTEIGWQVVAITRAGFPLDLPHVDCTPEELPEQREIDGVTYRHIEGPLRSNVTPGDYILLAADMLEQQFETLKPEAVIAASNYAVALPALIAARRLGIPFLYEIRGLWEITRVSREPGFDADPYFTIMAHLEAEVACQADQVFTLTSGIRDEMAERGVPPEKMTIVPNSCAPEQFTPVPRNQELAESFGIPDGVPVIGYIGTIIDYEGLDDLAHACILLAEQGVDFRLLVVGGESSKVLHGDFGPLTDEIQQIMQAAGLAHRLIMPGRVPHEQVADYYSLIDIAVFPRKPLPVCEMVSPIKPLEALATGKAVLASSVRALAEIITDGETGLLYEKGNNQDMAAKLAQLATDPDLREKLGQQGRHFVVTERNWQKSVSAFAEALAALKVER